MSALALELCDAGLEAVHERRGLLPQRSPGYAWVRGGRVVTGREAERRLRHEPRTVHHRFWQGLDGEPLGRPYPADLSTADLVWEHLRQAWEELAPAVDDVDRLVLALPGGWDSRQLGLLLGVARAAELPVVGLVDGAVAGTADVLAGEDELPRRVLHLRCGLHRSVLTELRVGTEVERTRVSLVELGLHELRDAWARHLASLFVRATRFDPLHRGDSEEQLFDRLEPWLERAIEQGTVVAELDGGRRSWTVELRLEDFERALDPLADRLGRAVGELRGGDGELLVVDRAFARLPALHERLQRESGARVRALPPGAAGRGVLLRAGETMPGGRALPFVTRLASVDDRSPA